LSVGSFYGTFWVTKAHLCHVHTMRYGVTSQGDWCPMFEGFVLVDIAMMKACNRVCDCVHVNELC